jgi:hypothetical protein
MMGKQSDGEIFFTNGARIVKLTNWLDWAIGGEMKTEQWSIVLPMIQRGSVWKPHQVIDLWDTLLRGMPFGGLMASRIPASTEGTKVMFCQPLDRKLVTLSHSGGLSLIDGQQRTLAMLLAWPAVGVQMHRRIWVDFGEDDKFDHLVRFHITSEIHPMGYLRGGNSGEPIGRLPLADRRRAAATYADRIRAVEQSASAKQKLLHDADIAPWHSTLALDLRLLIQHYRGAELALSDYVHTQMAAIQKNLTERIDHIKDKQPPFTDYDDFLREGIINHLQRRLNSIAEISQKDLDRRIGTLENGLSKLSQQYFPVIEVPAEVMTAETDDDTKDPPLAILFKRIGTGGTDLKTADYVFSVIKHLNPNCHALVEDQLKNAQIAAIFTPTALVMTAVRLTAAKLGRNDYAKLEKPQFTNLLRGDAKAKQDAASTTPFLPEFNRQIGHDGDFVKNLQAVLKVIAYQPRVSESSEVGALDVGLPKHALSIVQIPALEVILYWLQKHAGSQEAALQDNRHQLVRFILCWHLTVLDAAKASTVCIRTLKDALTSESCGGEFPEQKLFEELVAQQLALPILSPGELQQQQVLPIRISPGKTQMVRLTHSPEDVAGLRGSRRFVANTDGVSDEPERIRRQQAAKLYERWWNLRGGYSHALLLWLQRDYVHRCFEKEPAQPGLDDDTPYDFDHICPQSHWNYWTGKTPGHRLTDFHAERGAGADTEGHWRLGNALGNVRVWNSSENRGDGDAAPSVKLKLMPMPSMAEESKARLRDSAITDVADDDFADETQAWRGCDPDPVAKDSMHWTIARALAFQKAIELRTFNLYQRFYFDLRVADLHQDNKVAG